MFDLNSTNVLGLQRLTGNKATEEILTQRGLEKPGFSRMNGLPPVRGVVQPKPKDEEVEETSEETVVESMPFVSLATSPPPLPPDAPPDSNTTPTIPLPDAIQLKPLTLDTGTIMPKQDMNFGAGPPASPIAMSPPAANLDMPAMPHFAPHLDLPQPELRAPALNLNATQREDDDEGGLLSGVRSRINGIVDGLRSGWNSLTSMAEGAFESVRGQVSSVTDELGGLVSSAVSSVQSGWESVKETATQLTQGIQEQLNGPIDAIVGAAQSIADAVIRLDAGAIRAAWGRVTGLMGGLWQQVQQVGQAVFQRVRGLWDGLQNTFSGLMNNIASRASAVFDRVRSIAEGLGQRLSSAWESLQSRASQMSGVLGGILDRLRSLVSSLLSWGQQIWNGIQQQWGALRSRVSSLVAQVQQQVTSIWDGLRERANGVWDQVQSLWAGLQGWVQEKVGRITSGVLSLWQKFQNFSIGGLVDKIEEYVPVIRQIEQAVEDPEAILQPMMEGVAGKLESEMPGKALEIGRQHLAEQAGGDNAAPAVGESAPAGAGMIQRQIADDLIQRAPRTTASFGEVWEGFSSAISQKWEGLSVKDMLKHVWHDFLHPFDAIGRELGELFNKDLPKAVNNLFAIRGFSDPLGMLHDLWTNFLHLLDIPLAIWRRLNNIAMILMPWVTIFLVILGAIGGSVAGTVIGGIISALASLGIAAPAGAAAGAGAGGLTGAGAGFAAAGMLGELFLFSYIGAETATLIKILIELLSGAQTEEEKTDDYNQAADSVLGVGIALVLLAFSWIAGKIVSAAVRLFKQVRARLRPKVGPKVEPKVEPKPGEAKVPRGAALSEFPALKARAERLLQSIENFQKANPNVEGIAQMRKAVRGELKAIDRVMRGDVEATPARAQGARNNLNGIEENFRVAEANKNVVGVDRKFDLDGQPNKVEVDVVADGGKTWIEVKNVEPFGLESTNWTGRPGKQGLQQQAQELLRAASQQPNHPKVVVEFPSGVSQEVAKALRDMGIEVRGNVVRLTPRVPVPVPRPDDDDDGN